MTAHQAVNSGPSGVTGASEWIANGTPIRCAVPGGIEARGALGAHRQFVMGVTPVIK